MTAPFAALPENLADIPRREIPSLLLRLAALQTVLAVRLAEIPPTGDTLHGPPDYLSVDEAAARLKVPRDTIYRRWRRAPNAKKFGKEIRIPLSELHLLGEIPPG